MTGGPSWRGVRVPPPEKDRKSRSEGDSVNRFVNETQRDRLRQGRCARSQATGNRCKARSARTPETG